jgi:hypothetical protein
MSLSAFVGGIGVLGPGIPDWPAARAVLGGDSPYLPAPTVLPAPSMLPAAERRRTGRVVKLALAIAMEAVSRAGAVPARLPCVFTSSGGDGNNCHELCVSLAAAAREVSPTRFANSVHNAAAGYWSIATGATAAATVLCAFDASFAAGLIEALVQVAVDGQPLLLAAYDTDYPQPLRRERPIPDAFGTALVLTGRREAGSLARIRAALTDRPGEHMAEAPLETLRRSIPAARALPLLRRLALSQPGEVVLDYLDVSRVLVEVEPCR